MEAPSFLEVKTRQTLSVSTEVHYVTYSVEIRQAYNLLHGSIQLADYYLTITVYDVKLTHSINCVLCSEYLLSINCPDTKVRVWERKHPI